MVSHPLENHRHALADADAHGAQRVAGVAAEYARAATAYPVDLGAAAAHYAEGAWCRAFVED